MLIHKYTYTMWLTTAAYSEKKSYQCVAKSLRADEKSIASARLENLKMVCDDLSLLMEKQDECYHLGVHQFEDGSAKEIFSRLHFIQLRWMLSLRSWPWILRQSNTEKFLAQYIYNVEVLSLLLKEKGVP